MDPNRQPGVQIDKIFVDHLHFEHGDLARNAPLGSPVPELKFDVTYQANRLEGRGNRVLGTLKLSTARKEPFFYHVEVTLLAVVASTPGQENMPLEEYAMVPLASALYPFAREVVASVTGRGRHGPAYLKPFNFLAGAEAPGAPAAAARAKKVARRHAKPAARKR